MSFQIILHYFYLYIVNFIHSKQYQYISVLESPRKIIFEVIADHGENMI